jgi:hypothetical protein
VTKFEVGDRVLVRKPANVMQGPTWASGMDLFDGSLQRIRELVADGGRCGYFKLVKAGNYLFHPDWLEKVDPVEPIQSWVPEGYIAIEMAVPKAMADEIGDGNALVWRKPNRGQRYFALGLTTNVSRADFLDNYYPVIVPTTPPAEQYREPTQADVGKMVEVSDIKACLNEAATCWIEAELLAVLRKDVPARFVAYRLDPGFWKYARIKIEESK